MRWWCFISARNPIWRVSGPLMILAIVGVTGLYVARGPRPLKPTDDRLLAGTGTQGKFGTVTEPLDQGLFVLAYETITGEEEHLQLQGVKAKLTEPGTVWSMASPTAHKEGGVWTLFGPMTLASTDLAAGTPLGHGSIPAAGPALGWEKGIWHGLSPLQWEDLRGSARGLWDLPAGWTRGLDGKFVVDHGPIRWKATGPGLVQRMEAQRMWSVLGFSRGHLDDVQADLVGGQVKTHAVDIEPAWIHWSGPLTFVRDDGWHGNATGGQAPRPPEGGTFSQVDFTQFQAQRAMTGGFEAVRAEGARWTPAGLRLEGNVRLEQPLDAKRLLLQAPRVLQRNGPGADLPADLPVGETWAEGQAVLSWDNKSLSSPRIEGVQKTRHWRVQAPAYGRGEDGTFSAGEGQGYPAHWEFQGPILARFGEGASAQGDTLVWENNLYTLVGRPVTASRFRERLTGPRLVRRGELLDFPDGVAGALAALDGDINLQADRGRATRTLIELDGRVEVQGQGWRLQADHISVTLGAGDMVKQVDGKGGVFLQGRLGEGRGDALVLDPNLKTAHWLGRVKAVTEVNP